MRSTAQILIIGLGLSGLSPLTAQDVQGDLKEYGRSEKVASDSSIVTDGGPADRSGSGQGEKKANGLSSPTLQILSDDDGSKAVFGISRSRSWSEEKDAPNGIYAVKKSAFTLKATVPFEKNESQDSVFDFKGLAKGSTLTFGWSRHSTSVRDGSNVNDYLRGAYQKCIEENLTSWGSISAANKSILDEFRSDYQQQFSLTLNGLPAIQAQPAVGATPAVAARQAIPGNALSYGAVALNILASTPKYHKVGTHLQSLCDVSAASDAAISNAGQLIEKYLSRDEATRFINGFNTEENISFFGMDGTIGYNEFEYIDTVVFQKLKSNKLSFDGSAYIGLIDREREWAVRGKLSYTRAFENQNQLEICRPLNGGPEEECISGADGRPSRNQSAFASLEGRITLAKNADGSPKIAMAPEFTFDLEEDEYAVEVPIYLQRNREGALDGGIRFGYRSDTKDFGVGVFVGIPFTIFQ